MKKYRIMITEPAAQDLDDIFSYIAFELLEPGTSLNQIGRIEDQIRKLSELPLRHPFCPHEPWKSVGVRQLPVDNYIIYYVVHEESATVSITRILYGGSDVTGKELG